MGRMDERTDLSLSSYSFSFVREWGRKGGGETVGARDGGTEGERLRERGKRKRGNWEGQGRAW
jgi:hypothetical protein